MDLLKIKCNVEAPRLTKSKYGKTEVIQGSSDFVLYLILRIGMPYYQEECNIDYLTWSKVLIGPPSENPERKPLTTNSVLLGCSSLDLMDQEKPF